MSISCNEIHDLLEGTIGDGTIREGTLPQGTLRERAIREGTIREGTIRDGPIREGTLREGTLRQRTIPEGTIRDRTLRNGTLRDRTLREGSRDGVVVRALASHQCDKDFDSRTGRYHVARACCWFCSLLREVFLRVLRFSPLIETNTFKFQFDPECSHV